MLPEWTLAQAYAQALRERADFEARAAQAAAAHPMASLRRPRPASPRTPSLPLSSPIVSSSITNVSVPGSALAVGPYSPDVSPACGLIRPPGHATHPVSTLLSARYSAHGGDSVYPGSVHAASSSVGGSSLRRDAGFGIPSRSVGSSLCQDAVHATSWRPGAVTTFSSCDGVPVIPCGSQSSSWRPLH